MSEEEASSDKQKRIHHYMVRYNDEERHQLIEIGKVLEEEPGSVLIRQITRQYYHGKNLFKLYTTTSQQVKKLEQELTEVKTELAALKEERKS